MEVPSCIFVRKEVLRISYKVYNEKHWRPENYKMINHQTGKSTDLLVENIQFKVGLSPRDFNNKTLSRAR